MSPIRAMAAITPRGSGHSAPTPSTELYLWRVAALLWAGYIFWMSTGSFTSQSTRSVLARLFEQLFSIHVSYSTVRMIGIVIRKAAHMVEYAILAFLFYRSAGGRGNLAAQPKLASWCILAAVAYSLTDEFHQMFVPGREASLVDVCIDSIGALLALKLVHTRRAA